MNAKQTVGICAPGSLSSHLSATDSSPWGDKTVRVDQLPAPLHCFERPPIRVCAATTPSGWFRRSAPKVNWHELKMSGFPRAINEGIRGDRNGGGSVASYDA